MDNALPENMPLLSTTALKSACGNQSGLRTNGRLYQLKDALDQGFRLRCGSCIMYKTDRGYHMEDEKGPTQGYPWQEVLDHADFPDDEWQIEIPSSEVL
jgi:hypothetical protein